MFAKFSTAAILALASTSMVAAQTSTECNPLKKGTFTSFASWLTHDDTNNSHRLPC